MLYNILAAGAHPEIFKKEVSIFQKATRPNFVKFISTIYKNARYYRETGFRGNSGMLLQHLFIKKLRNNDFTNCCL